MEWGSEPECFGPRHYFRESILIAKVKKCIEGDAVLDAGCGAGSLTLRLAKAGFRVEAIDLADGFIEYVEKKAKERGLLNYVNVGVADITDIKFPDESFDAVVCGEVLEHIKKDNLAVYEFCRVLKRGGICVASVPAHKKLWDEIDVWGGHIKRYEKEELILLFENSGLKVEDIHFWGFPITRLYEKFVFLRIVNKKKQERTYGGPFRCANRFSKLNSFLSYFFWLDNLFNWTEFGIGLIIVGRKH